MYLQLSLRKKWGFKNMVQRDGETVITLGREEIRFISCKKVGVNVGFVTFVCAGFFIQYWCRCCTKP